MVNDFTDYDAVVEYLYNSVPLFQQQGDAAYKPGLQTTISLDEHLGRPHEKYPTIHVAGTNGKGSCCHTLAAIFQAAGYKTGLYTSPHLLDMRERIRVNGEMIPRQKVVDFVNRHAEFFEPLKPSFFELITAMAFDYFAEEKVDIAIIETGLGGRLDCTNIIRPLISIITNVSRDHTQLLGDTLEQIAAEKAGIIKTGVPVVVGETTPETRAVFTDTAARVGAEIVFAEDLPEVFSSDSSLVTRLKIKNEEVKNQDGCGSSPFYKYQTRSFGTLLGELSGACQPKNANTILVSLRTLAEAVPSLSVGTQAVRRGFAECQGMTGLMGRWQQLASSPDVFCDTGHNAGGWEYLSKQLRELVARYNRLHVVFGMAADKEVGRVLEMLPTQVCFYWTQAGVRRALPAVQLQQTAAQLGQHGEAFSDVRTAVKRAMSEAEPGDTVFIGGSTFVVAEALPLFQ